MSNTFAQINNAAHQGAFGKNDIPEPSLKQIAAGNYKKGSFNLHGLNIAIENPAFTYRRGTDKSGQSWSCLMQAAYGYIKGTTGADGDAIDVFVGHVPEQQTAYIINQKGQGGYFDEHKVMLGFLSQQQAIDTYNHCFERGWTGLMSVVPCTIEQLKFWLNNGDKSRPVKPSNLPYAGLERMDSVVWGGTDGANLYSHNGHLHQLMYQIRQSDTLGHALEPMRYRDMIEELGNDGFVYESYDALIVEYNKLERKAKQLLMVMQGAADTVKPVGVTVSKPLTKNGVANVIAWFEMDDGQAVGVFFHNPDKNPKKLDAQDEMISYKWVLNKKDITIAVAPENGKDIIIRTVAKRIMQLVEKNHDRFAKANSDKAELNQKEQSLGQLVIEKQSQLDALNDDIKVLEAKKADKEPNNVKNLRKQVLALAVKNHGWNQFMMFVIGKELDDVLYQADFGVKGEKSEITVMSRDSKVNKETKRFETVGLAELISKNKLDDAAYEFNAQFENYIISQQPEPVAQVVEPTTQERPSNWRTNLANARAVAKSLGLETKGKKLERLLKDIDIFDENEVKKQVLAEFKALAGRLVLPTGYMFDLSDAEKSINDVSMPVEAWITNKGKLDTDALRIELRVSPSTWYIANSVHIYTDNQTDKKAFSKHDYQRYNDIGAASPKTPKEIIAKMELYLTKVIFPEIEYQKVVNSKTIEPSKLSELGMANIESIGDENIYIEKDGKYYISKVGNTESYALGEWDFAKYPKGNPAAPVEPVTQPEPVSEPPMTNSDRDYLQSIVDGEDTGLEPKAITAKIREIISNAKDANNTELLSLADQAAKAYAAQVKAKAAAKLAEVQ